jgi:phage shock protein A
MWKLIKRLFGIGIAKANKAVDAIEDKTELLEQKLRELKSGYETNVNGVAKVKALEIKLKTDAKSFENKAEDILEKAKKLKAKVQNEEYDGDAGEAELENYILTMLNKYENLKNEATAKEGERAKQEQICKNLETKVKSLKQLISDTENNIVNIKAQSEAAKINKEVSKELSGVNVDGVSGQIEEIQRKINEDNAEAEAWVELDEGLEDDEAKIEKLLNASLPTADDKLLKDFMND